jgi:hypothetical protein
VVVVGLAIGLRIDALLKPVVGSQEYEVAPVPVVVKVTQLPLVILGSFILVINGPEVLLELVLTKLPGALFEDVPPI